MRWCRRATTTRITRTAAAAAAAARGSSRRKRNGGGWKKWTKKWNRCCNWAFFAKRKKDPRRTIGEFMFTVVHLCTTTFVLHVWYIWLKGWHFFPPSPFFHLFFLSTLSSPPMLLLVRFCLSVLKLWVSFILFHLFPSLHHFLCSMYGSIQIDWYDWFIWTCSGTVLGDHI